MSTPIPEGFVGRSTELRYAKALPNVDPSTLTLKRVGMCRGKSLDVQWDTADATGDTSPDYTRQNLVTFKSATISTEYVRMKADQENQRELIKHIVSPGAETDFQPSVYIEYTNPVEGMVISGFFIANTSNFSDGFDAEATGTLEFMSNSAITLDYPVS